MNSSLKRITLLISMISLLSSEFCLVGFRVSERSVHVEGEGAGVSHNFQRGNPHFVSILDFFLPSRNPLLMKSLMNDGISMWNV